MIDLKEIKPEYHENNLQEKTQGKDLFHAPQPNLTQVNNASWSSSSGAGVHLDGSNSTRLDNMAQRILDIETALIKLGLIRHI